jgi:diguanylate cyclase (GGDEF)-like protein
MNMAHQPVFRPDLAQQAGAIQPPSTSLAQGNPLPSKFALFLLLSLMACCRAQAAPLQVYRIGITSFRDKAVTVREWTPTMVYLESRIPGTHFELRPMNLPEFKNALARQQLDFVITNPEHYVVMEANYGFSRLATLVKRQNGKLVDQFGGVIFTRSDRHDILTLDDLRHKTIAATDRTSFAGFELQQDLLKSRGIDIDKDDQVRFMGFPQDLNVMAVLSGRADVGFVRSSELEDMAREGRVDLSRIRILNAQHANGFPFLLSTRLYPEWPLAAAPQVPFEIKNQVVAALLMMPPASPAGQSAHYYRWSTPPEYEGVRSFMQRNRIYPFDQPPQITLFDVLQEYALYLLPLLIIVALALALLYVRTRRLNIELHRSRIKLKDMAHHDALTGLPNRLLLDDRLRQALSQAQVDNKKIAVCLLDLDGFKPINDKFGHPVGDALLITIAERIKSLLRETDTVARYGGDEFILLLNGDPDEIPLDEILQRVLSAVAQDCQCCEGARVSASVGVSLYPLDAADIASLFLHADEAMYQAKKDGGNRYALYRQPQLAGGGLALHDAPGTR